MDVNGESTLSRTVVADSEQRVERDGESAPRNQGPPPNRRPRLLFLSQTLPYPPDGGVHIRTYNVLRLLARSFDVTALCFYRARERKNESEVAESVRALSRWAKVEAFAIPQEHSRIRLLWDHFRSAVMRRAYTDYAYASAVYESRVRSILQAEDFDFVHVDSLDLAPYLPLLTGLPVACVHHNVESVLLRRMAEAQTAAWKQTYIRMQAQWVEDAERKWCPEIDLNVAVSATDKETLHELAPDSRIAVVPNGVDIKHFSPSAGEKRGIVCVGGVSGLANRDGLAHFCENILPHLPEVGSTVPARWVGRASEEEQRLHRERYGVELTGYVPDIRPYVHQAACYVVPLRVGGGTRIKILDAWAMGKAVVSTSVGCEGLKTIDGENILVRDDPDDFAAAVRDVLRDAGLRDRLGAAARETVEREYSWERIGEDMVGEYLRVLGERAAEAPFQPREGTPASRSSAALGSASPERWTSCQR